MFYFVLYPIDYTTQLTQKILCGSEMLCIITFLIQGCYYGKTLIVDTMMSFLGANMAI